MTGGQWIYALLGPDDKAYYVGRTSNFVSRISGHLRLSTRHALEVARACGSSDLRAAVLAADATSTDEREWIARLRSDGHPLINAEPPKRHVCAADVSGRIVWSPEWLGAQGISAPAAEDLGLFRCRCGLRGRRSR